MRRALWFSVAVGALAAAAVLARSCATAEKPGAAPGSPPGWDPTGSHPLPNREAERGPAVDRTQ